MRGQAGVQVFFNEADRAFCLYVVLGAFDACADVVPEVNRVLATMEISGGSEAPVKGTVLDAIRAQPDWSTFESLLDESGVAKRLEAATDVTVFAPMNMQISASGLTEIRADPDLLQRTVLQHVIDERLPLDVLTMRTSLTTAAGGTLTVTGDDGLHVDDFAVSAPIEGVDGFVYPTAGLFEAPK